MRLGASVRRSLARVVVGSVVGGCVLVGCAPAAPSGTSTDDPSDLGTAAEQDGGPAVGGEDRPTPHVRIEGAELVLVAESGDRTLHELSAADGEPIHAVLRPGGHAVDTVLLLTRLDDEQGVRYELRYLVAGADEVSDLYWFPWRLQVAETAATVLDVPPLPVWAPDGTELAWIEWTEQGTRLRTVGWIDDGTTRNPSDDTASYVLEEVPAGVQLESWEQGPDGAPVLIGRRDGQPYRIEVVS